MTWQAPSTLAADAIDERPVLARSGATLLACWTRTTDLGAYGRQAVLCRRSPDGGMTWDAPAQRSPAAYAGRPVRPVRRRRRGGRPARRVQRRLGRHARTPSGLDSAWVAHSADGLSWSAPVRVARFRSLPERFAGDSFRNVTLLSLAATRARTYLAYAADVGGQADIQLTHSDDGARWSTPITIGADASGADQFQPSLAAAGRTTSTSASSTAASVRRSSTSGSRPRTIAALRGARSGSRTTPGTRRSARRARPTGDLLGDHQALVADRCTRSRWPPTRTSPTTGSATRLRPRRAPNGHAAALRLDRARPEV